MTIHFISETLERKSYTLTCKRIHYNHTYENIALIIHHILKEFTLDVTKITHIVTDNATNFGKVFRYFGVTRFESSNRVQFNVEENENILSDMDSENLNWIQILKLTNLTKLHQRMTFIMIAIMLLLMN